MSAEVGRLADLLEELEAGNRGRGHEYTTQIRDHETTIRSLQEPVSTLRAEGSQRASTISSLRSNLTSKELLLAQCQSERNELRDQVTARETNTDTNDTLREQLQQ